MITAKVSSTPAPGSNASLHASGDKGERAGSNHPDFHCVLGSACTALGCLIRGCDRAGDFGQQFIELACSVYQQSDCRAAIKRRINLIRGRSGELGPALRAYFTTAATGRFRAQWIVPSPSFVASDMIYAMQAADICIYCVNWGFRAKVKHAIRGWVARKNPEREALRRERMRKHQRS